jgi:hypothetical protein
VSSLRTGFNRTQWEPEGKLNITALRGSTVLTLHFAWLNYRELDNIYGPRHIFDTLIYSFQFSLLP